MAIYFQTKSGIMIKEFETPMGLVYVKKSGDVIKKVFNEKGDLIGFSGGEILEKVFNEKGELVGFKDSKGNFIDDFVKDGRTESLALHKLSFDVYPDPNSGKKRKPVAKVENAITPDTKARLLEKTKKTKKDYVTMFNKQEDGGKNEKKDE